VVAVDLGRFPGNGILRHVHIRSLSRTLVERTGDGGHSGSTTGPYHPRSGQAMFQSSPRIGDS
jgi:hypothetical protein